MVRPWQARGSVFIPVVHEFSQLPFGVRQIAIRVITGFFSAMCWPLWAFGALPFGCSWRAVQSKEEQCAQGKYTKLMSHSREGLLFDSGWNR